jgi:hypothetical protein
MALILDELVIQFSKQRDILERSEAMGHGGKRPNSYEFGGAQKQKTRPVFRDAFA